MSGNVLCFSRPFVRLAAVIPLAAGLSMIAADVLAQAAPLKKQATVVQSSWDGFYIGLGVGTRSTQTDAKVTDTTTNGVSTLAPGCAVLVPFGGCVTGEPLNNTDFRFSPYVGFNWQFARQWVVGIEGDWGSGNKTTTLSGMRFPTSTQLSNTATDTFSVRTTWDASARARIGFLADPSVLLYATGGAAWLRVSSTSTCNPLTNGACNPPADSGPLVITHAATKTGWTAGGGVEAMLGANWIVRGEYRYADFGTLTQTSERTIIGPTQQTITYDLHVRTHTATFGLAYKFGGERRVAAAENAQAAVGSSWSGPYLGLGLGARSTQTDATVTSFTRGNSNTLAAHCATASQIGGCVTSEPLNDSAFRINPYAGFNWQIAPRWVLGVEGDFGFANKTTTLEGMSYPFDAAAVWSTIAGDTFSVKTTWDASIRGRAGFVANPSVMVYGTAGPAWMHVESTSTCRTVVNALCAPASAVGPIVISHATTKLGWTAGGGVEGRLSPNWIARAEYRYADFGTISNSDVRTGGAGMTASYDLRVTSHTATLGLAYKLDWDRSTATR